MPKSTVSLCGTLALILVACQKQDAEIETHAIEYDDDAYFLDGLVKRRAKYTSPSTDS